MWLQYTASVCTITMHMSTVTITLACMAPGVSTFKVFQMTTTLWDPGLES